jgi:hypothetical protein
LYGFPQIPSHEKVIHPEGVFHTFIGVRRWRIGMQVHDLDIPELF